MFTKMSGTHEVYGWHQMRTIHQRAQKKGTCELASKISSIPNPSIAARPFVTSALGEKTPAETINQSQQSSKALC